MPATYYSNIAVWSAWCLNTTATTATTAGGYQTVDLSAGVWGIWTTAASGGTSNATVPCTNVWRVWNENITTGTAHVVPAQSRQLTAAEQEAERQRIEELRRQRAEEVAKDRQRDKEDAARRAAAAKRADRLLRRHLSTEQERMWGKERRIIVVAGDGKRYEIKHGSHGNIAELDEQGRKVARLCINITDHRAPLEDNVLAQKLALEIDPVSFRRTANITLLTPQPA